MKYSRELFGSELTIHSNSSIDESIIQTCFETAHQFEQNYSRFISWNTLDILNTQKTLLANTELISMIQLCLKVSKITHWYFDITLLPILENLGYGKQKQQMEEHIGYENIVLSWNTVTLKNHVSIELGAVWKGYIIDIIYNILAKKTSEFIIDFGGDIRVKWKKKIGLEDPKDAKKLIGSIEIENLSIASSAWNKRTFWNSHHLMNPKTKISENNKIWVYVTHKLASFADIFSTALFVTPLDMSLEILNKIDGLEGLIIAQDGSMYQSTWFISSLNKVW